MIEEQTEANCQRDVWRLFIRSIDRGGNMRGKMKEKEHVENY